MPSPSGYAAFLAHSRKQTVEEVFKGVPAPEDVCEPTGIQQYPEVQSEISSVITEEVSIQEAPKPTIPAPSWSTTVNKELDNDPQPEIKFDDNEDLDEDAAPEK